MSTNPPAPIVPPAGDSDAVARNLAADEEQPLDPDANPDDVNSAEADRRAAQDGELDGDAETPGA